MVDTLTSLKPYFDEISEHEEEKLDELHAIFQEHFLDNPFRLNGKLVVVKRHPYNPGKDGLPDHFAHYFEKFVHVVTRTIDNKRGIKEREFRQERANRIHWIKTCFGILQTTLEFQHSVFLKMMAMSEIIFGTKRRTSW